MGKCSIVIFDLDGTLTDPGAGIVSTIRSVIAELGGKAPRAEELKWCVGPPLREIFARLLAPEERIEALEGKGGSAEPAEREEQTEGEGGFAEAAGKGDLLRRAGKEERAGLDGEGGFAEAAGKGELPQQRGKHELAEAARTDESEAPGKDEPVGWAEAARTGESKASGKSEPVERAAALYVQRYAESGAAESVAYKGVKQMLTDLRKVARLFVVTSKNTVTAERILGTCGLKRHFEEVIGNGRLDDKTDLVRDLIDREGIERGAAAMVGNRDHDIVAGHRSAIFTVGVTYGYGSREELEAAGADRICESPAESARLLLSAGD
jgi:phosphoglycolate phosphatase-like HAD superfamily hydrolase